MDETRKISLLMPSSGKTKNTTELLLNIRLKIQEMRRNQPELSGLDLANVGMYRERDGIRVNLYFSKFDKIEKKEFVSTEERAEN